MINDNDLDTPFNEIPEDEFEEIVEGFDAYREWSRDGGDEGMESLTFGDY
jgi:hypothetical protein